MSLVLGLDVSTQSLTAVVIDTAAGRVVHQQSVNFDDSFPEYGTCHGVLPHDDPRVVHAPPLLWVAALDSVLSGLQGAVDVSRVAAIAGSAQQHATVYLNDLFEARLAGLVHDQPLTAQLACVFARPTAPVWLDASTSTDVEALNGALGGAERCAHLTGSVGCERFSGPQIRRFARMEPTLWERTAHVQLASSFLASLLLGKPAPADFCDASGMNLLDLATRAWDPDALQCCGGDALSRRLGKPVAPCTVLGSTAPALALRYGFPVTCQIVTWTGDNPSSAVGLGLVDDGACALSLGTSDVLFAITRGVPSLPCGGHVFVAPTGAHMALFCFANGSLAREHVRDAHCLDWGGFDAALHRTVSGNGGAMMLPWLCPEIVPKVLKPGIVRFQVANSTAEATDSRTPETSSAAADADCRAVVEGQFTSMRLRADAAGIRPRLLRATGGAAQNAAILQIAADVFQCPVRRCTVTNSAALGAAMCAAHALNASTWQDLTRLVVEPLLGPEIAPRTAFAPVYACLAAAYLAEERLELHRRSLS